MKGFVADLLGKQVRGPRISDRKIEPYPLGMRNAESLKVFE